VGEFSTGLSVVTHGRSKPSTAANPERLRETVFEPERALLSFARRRVRLALGVGEERRAPLVLFERRSDRGVLLFAYFLLDKQEKVRRPRFGNRNYNLLHRHRSRPKGAIRLPPPITRRFALRSHGKSIRRHRVSANPTTTSSAETLSPWVPLRQPLFRWLWIAAFASYIGTWIQDVGAAWLMTSLSSSPVMIALVRTASAFPMFLFALPAGALADVLDRRRLLLFTQTLMLLAAAALAVLTFTGLTTALSLLLLTFALGVGTALNAPAWQATMAELVPRAQLMPAIALNSASINLARSVGPAIGGLLIAAIGPAANFALNALSFCGVVYVLYRWRREPVTTVLPAERVLGAIRTGVRYVRHAPPVLSVLARSSSFTVFAIAMLALLPTFARFHLGRGPTGYGILLGFFGAGAVLAAVLLSRARARLSAERIVAIAIIVFAIQLFVLAWAPFLPLVHVALFIAGGAWLTLLSTFNASIQAVVPSWVRGRALAVSILIFFGSLALGATLWGYIATAFSMSTAFTAAGIGLLLGLAATHRLRIVKGEELDLSPSVNWPAPNMATELAPHDGPVVVTAEYVIEPDNARHFRRIMRRVRRIRRRDGAISWGLLANVEHANHYTETFVVESWLEHLRQHERVTVSDRAVLERARALHVGSEPPRVTHYVVEPLSR
jgi:MFS family permease